MHAEHANDPDTEDQHVCQSVGEFNEEAFRYIVVSNGASLRIGG